MLVLSRKKNEQIIIGGNIAVTVVDVRGDKVCLGIDAADGTPIHRREIAIREWHRQGRGEEVRDAMRRGVLLHQIQDELDRRENQENTGE